jgi:hypothetical protein
MSRLILRQIKFEHESVVNGLLVPLRQDVQFLSCSCTSIPSPDVNKTTSIGWETHNRSWCGRICVVDGDAGNYSEVEGIIQEVNVTEWYNMRSQADENDKR